MSKIAIVGTGFVGATTAYTIMQEGLASSIALIDVKKEKAEGEALDLIHGMQFVNSMYISAGDSYELVKDAKVIIICAGINQKPGQPREELVKTNVAIFKSIIPEIIKYNKDAILLVVTNPLDILTYVTYKLSGFSATKVFGTGTVLDTSRLRFLLGSYFNISPKDITAYILGEHGDSQFVWWSHANIAGIPIDKMSSYSKNILENIHQDVKNAVYEVIRRKGATYFAISVAVTEIVKAILLNQSRVFTISSYLDRYGEYEDVCLSLPTVINENGISQKLPLFLDKTEEKLLAKSIEKIKEGIKNI